MGQRPRPGRHTRGSLLLASSWRAALLLVLYWALVPLAQAEEAGDLLPQLKVAYLYNFTRFVEWTPLPEGQPFVIGVMGDPGLEDRLRTLEREGKRAAGRPIQVRLSHPLIYARPNTSLNVRCPSSISPKRCTSGRSRSSGIIGISS